MDTEKTTKKGGQSRRSGKGTQASKSSARTEQHQEPTTAGPSKRSSHKKQSDQSSVPPGT
ncbi:hypothetical protein TGPRC2_210682 [Toxoplasma gondii TgCatPRC2]|uniref:Uncharacterized protein n=15 Tax=Toxoplasma gondii TaxID=5811 RepID=A0A125YHA2_TOXGV|nr:hypothetical protein TGME49_210682 [Toxoplasma gondii ME49]EPR58291.1 hypothetical protein TGGT1_210682 [Toxoplasma gondii GT1]ESS29686.1 hypothetical protein TGVEG_210682 [Toxoplasma gondii VEG]KFG30735.1 hypothetical protein TGDOM2_210682 [Toxoplasma gondii GAB2-2007-GAL-DOM2]KFG38794.1 hypothetical protein TGFOU_210682 [Toxoplasma gondii FOU]KFG43115.1 hypothetical protein TGP89_210682 [Toxoplasma gondii p89]KFG57915.1 hypothetical protein TGRUB_210682 [Toxoplasma gondii RUB]KFG99529.1|eukprot:XP_018637952.1 hypothetical protein TGME49_210682 [Toxoplasma gondii ME49]